MLSSDSAEEAHDTKPGKRVSTVEEDLFLSKDDAKSGSLNDRQPIVDLVISQAVMGAGILGYPFVFRSCGVALAVILVLGTLIVSEFSMHLLILSGHIASQRSYSDLASYCFGYLGRAAVDGCGMVMALGSVVACLNISADVFSLVAGTVIPPGAEPSRNMILAGVTLCVAMPIAVFVRNSPMASATSKASAVFLLLFCGLLTLLALSTSLPEGELTWWQGQGVLIAFPVVCYSFTAHQSIFSVYASLRGSNLKRTTTVIQRAMVASCGVYVIIGVCGFLVYGQKTSGDILRNLGGSVGSVRLPLERFLKVGYGLILLLSIPMTLGPLQATLGAWTEPCHVGDNLASTLKENAIILAALGASCAAAVYLPNVEFVLGLMGSTAAMVVSFILPAAIFLRTTSIQRGGQGYGLDMTWGSPAWLKRRRAAGALLLFGLISGVLCTGTLVAEIQEEAEVVALARELVKLEKRAVAAATTGAAAIEVAEKANTVTAVKQQLESTRIGTSQSVDAIAKATQALSEAGASLKRQRAAVHDNADLVELLEEADKASAVLEAAVMELNATAMKASSSNHELKSVGSDGYTAITLSSSGSGNSSAAGAESGAAMLSLSDAAKQSLEAMQQSRAALAEVKRAMQLSRKGKEHRDIDEVLQLAVNATKEAAIKLNATYEALHSAEAQQVSQLVDIVADLNKEKLPAVVATTSTSNSGSNATTALDGDRKVVKEQKTSSGSRKLDPGTLITSSEAREQREKEEKKEKGGTSITLDEQWDSATAAVSVDVKALGQQNGTAPLNVSGVALEAAAVAAQVVELAKTNVEVAIQQKKEKVAERAIEIAKELTHLPGNASALEGAAAKQEEIKIREVSKDIADGTVVKEKTEDDEAGAVVERSRSQVQNEIHKR